MKKILENRLYVGGIGIGFLVLAVILFITLDVVKEGQVNYALALLVAVLAAGGGFAILNVVSAIYNHYFGSSNEGGGGSGFKIDKWSKNIKQKVKGKAVNAPNTLYIIARKNEEGQLMPYRILFAYCTRPKGHMHKCENNGKYYYVHMVNLDKREIRELILPDTVYLDPRKYVIPLTMPADEAYWRPQVTLWTRIAPAALIVTIIFEWIIFITTGG